MKIKNLLVQSIVTFFGVGKITYAPGTCGSLCAYPLLIFILKTASKYGLFIYYSPIKFVLCIVTLLTGLGIYATSLYIKIAKDNDPSEVVIDEVVGQLITIIGVFYFFTFIPKDIFESLIPVFKNMTNLVYLKLVSCFVLFRFFDIVKPWPVSFADKKIKGGLGVMLDDIFAAFLSIITFFIVLYTWHYLNFPL
jgi:phosphatidylglycerophosphatase A